MPREQCLSETKLTRQRTAIGTNVPRIYLHACVRTYDKLSVARKDYIDFPPKKFIRTLSRLDFAERRSTKTIESLASRADRNFFSVPTARDRREIDATRKVRSRIARDKVECKGCFVSKRTIEEEKGRRPRRSLRFDLVKSLARTHARTRSLTRTNTYVERERNTRGTFIPSRSKVCERGQG